jgi:hypothetical protein
MSAINLTVVVLGIALVLALFTRLDHHLPLPAWLSPLRLTHLLGLLKKLLPWIQKGEGLAIALGYLLVVLLLCNASVLVVLLAMSVVSRWLFAESSGRYIEQVA